MHPRNVSKTSSAYTVFDFLSFCNQELLDGKLRLSPLVCPFDLEISMLSRMLFAPQSGFVLDSWKFQVFLHSRGLSLLMIYRPYIWFFNAAIFCICGYGILYTGMSDSFPSLFLFLFSILIICSHVYIVSSLPTAIGISCFWYLTNSNIFPRFAL